MECFCAVSFLVVLVGTFLYTPCIPLGASWRLSINAFAFS